MLFLGADYFTFVKVLQTEGLTLRVFYTLFLVTGTCASLVTLFMLVAFIRKSVKEAREVHPHDKSVRSVRAVARMKRALQRRQLRRRLRQIYMQMLVCAGAWVRG